MYAEKECWRGEYPGRGRAMQGIAAARGAVVSNVIVYARRNQQLVRLPPRWGGHGGVSGAVCNNEPNRSQRTTKTSIPRRSISLTLSSLQVRLTSGRDTTTSVIDTINRRATKGGLAGTYPYKSKHPIRHSATQPDCNCRCNPDSRMDASKNLLRVAFSVCDARCTLVQLRFSTETAAARDGFLRRPPECAYTFFSTEFAHGGAGGARPCVKYRFNSYTSRGLTAACRLYIQNEGLREISGKT